MSGHYEMLRVSKEASAEDIRKAYRARSQAWHLERNPKEAQSQAEMELINEAYRVLSNEALRAEYDQGLPEAAAGEPRLPQEPASEPAAGEARAPRSEAKSKAGLLLGAAALLAAIGAGVGLSSGGDAGPASPEGEVAGSAAAARAEARVEEQALAEPEGGASAQEAGGDPAVALLAAQSAEEARKLKAKAEEEQKAKEKELKEKELKEKEFKEKEFKEKEFKEKEAKEKEQKEREAKERELKEREPKPRAIDPRPAPALTSPAPALAASAAPIAPTLAAPRAAAQPAAEASAGEPRLVPANVACPTQAVPALPKMGPNSDLKEATVRVKALVEGGEIKSVKFTYGPREYYPTVKAAMARYKCVNAPGEMAFLQEFHFKPDGE